MKIDSSLSTRTSSAQPESGYFNLIAGLFVATLLISNTVAAKPWQVASFVFPGGAILFPISYLFGDVLTEVYGYARARQVIWTGFAANALMALTYWIVIRLPPAPFWANQIAFTQILGQVPRIVLASFVAYLVGEFANSFVLANQGALTFIRTAHRRRVFRWACGVACCRVNVLVRDSSYSQSNAYVGRFGKTTRRAWLLGHKGRDERRAARRTPV
jgi:Putative vitamin uptake transporter